MTSQLLLDWLGRVLMAALFVKAVPGKLTDFSGTVDVIASKGIAEPLAGFLLASAITCLILGSVVFVFGTNTRLGASLLLVFRTHHADFSHVSGGSRLLHEPGPDWCIVVGAYSVQCRSSAQLSLATAPVIGQR